MSCNGRRHAPRPRRSDPIRNVLLVVVAAPKLVRAENSAAELAHFPARFPARRRRRDSISSVTRNVFVRLAQFPRYLSGGPRATRSGIRQLARLQAAPSRNERDWAETLIKTVGRLCISRVYYCWLKRRERERGIEMRRLSAGELNLSRAFLPLTLFTAN